MPWSLGRRAGPWPLSLANSTKVPTISEERRKRIPIRRMHGRFEACRACFLGGTKKQYLKRALRLSPLDPLIFARQIGLAIANFQCGRYEEALQWGLTSLRHNPTWMGSRRFIIAFYALSGRIDDAKAAWKALRQVDPTMRISNVRVKFPLRRDEDFARLAEGYRLAGVPE